MTPPSSVKYGAEPLITCEVRANNACELTEYGNNNNGAKTMANLDNKLEIDGNLGDFARFDNKKQNGVCF